jgi:hypothetical protein
MNLDQLRYWANEAAKPEWPQSMTSNPETLQRFEDWATGPEGRQVLFLTRENATHSELRDQIVAILQECKRKSKGEQT